LEGIKKLNTKKVWAKGTRLFSDLLEKTLQVYNGCKFVDVPVKKEMLGTYMGSYVLCKRITADIHSKTRRNKRGRQKKKKNNFTVAYKKILIKFTINLTTPIFLWDI